jgi:hypothetical protein
VNLLVQTPDEILAGLPMPELADVDDFGLIRDDWLVVCAGFEDRALCVLQSAIAGQRPFNVLLISYEPFVPQNRAEAIRQICHRGGINLVELAYHRREPLGFGAKVIETLSGSRGRILVDVSAMTRLLIVQLLVALCAKDGGFSNCFVAFAEAREYPPTQAEAEAELAKSELDPTFSVLFLSSGVFEITILPELSSFALAAPQTRLVCFPSLDAHHLIALRAELQPSRLTIIEGVPPHSQNQWRQKVISKVNRLDQVQNAEFFQTSTLDYRETLHCLLQLYTDHAVKERILVAPTGSKMQTVAVGLFRSFVEDVQIVYPTPGGYCSPDNYTKGTGKMHLLPLAPFHK